MKELKESTTRRILLLGFLCTVALYGGVWAWRPPEALDWLRPVLLLSASVFPAFFLQSWLLSGPSRPRLAWFPLFALGALAAAGSLWQAAGAPQGWLLLSWTLAPAAGCCIGWMRVQEIRLFFAVGVVGLYLLYLGLKVLYGTSILEFWSFDVPSALIFDAGCLVNDWYFRKLRQQEAEEEDDQEDLY